MWGGRPLRSLRRWPAAAALATVLLLVVAAALVWAPGGTSALAAAGDPALPDYHARVNDFASVLKSQERQAIEDYLAQLEQQTGAQVAVAIVQTTAPLDPVDYKVKLFEKWMPGQKGQDNGLLVLVAMQEHRVEVATGYGLEGVLPDAKVGRILDQQVMPRIRKGDFGGGILAGVQAFGAEIAKEPGTGVAPGPGAAGSTAGSGHRTLSWVLLMLALPVLVLGAAVLLLILGLMGVFRPRCPQCRNRMLVTDRIVQHATAAQEGVGLKIRHCPKCGHEDERQYTIPRQKPDEGGPPTYRRGGGGWGGMGGMGGMGGFGRRGGGSGGSGGFGGFGGGSTGGGGAGRSW